MMIASNPDINKSHRPKSPTGLPRQQWASAVAFWLVSVVMLRVAEASNTYRLTGVCAFEPHAGRLEVQPNASADFGTVCDDSFDQAAALAACRSLGFADTERAYVFGAPGGRGPIYADNVSCSNNASDLSTCELSNGNANVADGAPPVTSCTHAEDVGIQCVLKNSSGMAPPHWEYRLTGGGEPGQGLLEVRPRSDVPWGSVCGGSFTRTEGLVACRALGFDNVTSENNVSVKLADPNSDADPANDELRTRTYLSLVNCSHADANTTALERCAHVPVPYAHCRVSEAVYLGCGVGATFRYRLDGGHATMGVIEMKTPQDPDGQWLGVCDDSFDRTDALVACRSVFPDSTHAMLVDYWEYMPNHYYWDYAMDEVECTGEEASLDECYFETNHDCDEEDVAVQCFGPTASALHASIKYRVDAASGLVEVERDGRWGRVVYNALTAPDQRFADAVCTAIGEPVSANASAHFWLSAASPVARDVSMVAASCSRLPDSMPIVRPDECFWATDAYRVTSRYNLDLYVNCSASLSYTYRLDPIGTAGVSQLIATANFTTHTTDMYIGATETFQKSQDLARKMCESMGVADTWAPFLFSMPNPNASVPMTGLSLGVGSSRRIDHTAVASSSQVRGIVCTTRAEAAAWEYRLVNGSSPTQGMLQVRPNSTAEWGVVGADSRRSKWFLEEFPRGTAQLLCRALGLPEANASSYYVPTNDVGPALVYWENLQCGGGEASPAVCMSTPYPAAILGYRGAIALSCGEAPPTKWKYRLADGGSNWGRLEVQPSEGEPWYSITSSYMTGTYHMARHVACRSLGFGLLSMGTVLTSIQGGVEKMQKRFFCQRGDEADLAMCQVVTYSWTSNPVTLQCTNGSADVRVDPWFDSHPGSEAHSASMQFGGWRLQVSICCKDRNISQASMSVLCGFDSRVGGTATAWYGMRDSTLMSTVAVTDLDCPETAVTLEQCAFSATASPPCTSQDFLYLQCQPNQTDVVHVAEYWATHKYGFALQSADEIVMAPASGTGRLLARTNTTAPWGTLCRTTASQADDDHMALAACRSSGYGASVAGYMFDATPMPGVDVLLADAHCVSGAPTLDRCMLTKAAEDAGAALRCLNTSTVIGVQCVQPAGLEQAWAYRLHGTEQLLEIRPLAEPDAAWGTVCSDSDLGGLAPLACGALGLPTEDSVAYLVDAGAADLAKPVHMSGVSCFDRATGSGKSPQSCRHVPREFATCTSGRRVGLRCGREGPRYAGVRLVDSSFPGSGLVEIQTTPGGSFAPVCSGGSVDTPVALAVCRSLGFLTSSVVATWLKRYEKSKLKEKKALGYLRCHPGYDDVSNCTFDAPVGFDGSCEGSLVLGVSCVEPAGDAAAGIHFKLDRESATHPSPLSVRLNATGAWEPVCYTSRPDVLNAICQALGYPGSDTGRGVAFPSGLPGIRFEGVGCPPGATHFSQCGASYGQVAGPRCSQLQISCSPKPIKYRFKNGGVSEHKGIVETYRTPYYYSRNLGWYELTTYAYSWIIVSASRQPIGASLCRAMGYGERSINVPTSAVRAYSGGRAAKFSAFSMNPLDKPVDSFSYSNYELFTTTVDCSASLQPTVWEAELVIDSGDDAVPGRGLLHVRPRTPDDSAVWGGVVAETIPQSLAHGLCITFGFASGGVVVPRHQGTGSRIIYIQTLMCPPGALSLSDCMWSSNGTVGSEWGAGLQCFNASIQPSEEQVAVMDICANSVNVPTPVPPVDPTKAAPATSIPTPHPAVTWAPTPVPPTPIPMTPLPETPLPSTPLPQTPIPETPVPATPLPSTIVPPVSTSPPPSASTAKPPAASTTSAPTPTTTEQASSLPPFTTSAPTTTNYLTATPSSSAVVPEPTTTLEPTVLPTLQPHTDSPIPYGPSGRAASSTNDGNSLGETAGVAAGTSIGILLFVALVIAVVLAVRQYQKKTKQRLHRDFTAGSAERHSDFRASMGEREPSFSDSVVAVEMIALDDAHPNRADVEVTSFASQSSGFGIPAVCKAGFECRDTSTHAADEEPQFSPTEREQNDLRQDATLVRPGSQPAATPYSPRE